MRLAYAKRILKNICLNYTALVTLPERRQRVQTFTWTGVPFTTALTRRTLGFQARLDLLWECESWIPKATPFPQISHFAIPLHLLEVFVTKRHEIYYHNFFNKAIGKTIFFEIYWHFFAPMILYLWQRGAGCLSGWDETKRGLSTLITWSG